MSSTRIGFDVPDAVLRQANAVATQPVRDEVRAFSREAVEDAKRPARAGHAGSVGPARHAGAVEASPVTDVAHGLLAACGGLQNKLLQQGVHHPEYLGSMNGQWVYRNPATKEVCVQNIETDDGLLGLRNFQNVCAIEPDGRVFLNGQPVTMDHPDAAKVEQCLTKLLRRVAGDDLPRSFLGGNTLMPPWNPMAPSHGNYVH